MQTLITIDGNTLDPETLQKLSLIENGMPKYRIQIDEQSLKKVRKAREFVDEICSSGRTVYGINTGFGNFASVTISSDKLRDLQLNLITSHAAGTGIPISLEQTRMLFALRINVLAKGYSGISEKTLLKIVQMFNENCLSYVPSQGTVGASGDLAQLSHLTLGLIGRGKMYDFDKREYVSSELILQKKGIEKITLGPKEGLSMINGTQFITALGVEALLRSESLVKLAAIVSALTLEVLKGSVGPFKAKIHNARPHKGQQKCAERMRILLEPSSVLNQSHGNCTRVQDSYTLRCIPQVHGIAEDTCGFVRDIFQTEMNSATDNPMIFAGNGEAPESLSCGNFHGEYPAKACDYLAIGIAELGVISERRTERLVNGQNGLKEFLVDQGGLNSGFMIAHCTAAALVSENKVLVHPASSDSIPTSASKEDHVSMGGYSARKALQIVENVEKILAIELICACQALNFLRPSTTTPSLEKVFEKVRSKIEFWARDREMWEDIESAWLLVKSGDLIAAAESCLLGKKL